MKRTILLILVLGVIFRVEAMYRICATYTHEQEQQATGRLEQHRIDFDAVYKDLRKLERGVRKDADFLVVWNKLQSAKQDIEAFLTDLQNETESSAVNAELFDNLLTCRAEINRIFNAPVVLKRLRKLDPRVD